MRIPDKKLNEFIQIYKEEFGEELSRAEANEITANLLMLYERLARKMSSKPEPAADDHPQIGFRT